MNSMPDYVIPRVVRASYKIVLVRLLRKCIQKCLGILLQIVRQICLSSSFKA